MKDFIKSCWADVTSWGGCYRRWFTIMLLL